MIKNLGKFKQWTNEKFGGARVTLQTEDFQRLVQETEHRRGGYDKIVESVEILLSYILKRKTSPEDSRKKMLPLESFGSCLYHYGTVFPEDSGLGVALLNVGQIETRIAILQEVLADEIKTHYMTMLQNGIKEYKEYDTLKKKLASRRLDYDSKLSKLKKAKKEKPDLEQEIQAARIKYEDTEHDLIQKMAILQEFEDEHKNALLQVVDAQLAYHEQAHDLLLGLKSTWGEGRRDSGGSLLGRLVPRNEDNNNTTTTTTTLQPNNISNTSISKSSCSSNSSNNAAEVASNNTSGSNSSASNRTKSFIKVDHDHYRKAIYDFNGENEDEISFKAGDVITVINQIDKGWWVGEIHNKQGIFPVNFTEEYKSTG